MNNENTSLEMNILNMKRNIEGLINVNKDILEEMRKFTETDERVRYMIDRRNRVNDLKSRADKDNAATNTYRSGNNFGY